MFNDLKVKNNNCVLNVGFNRKPVKGWRYVVRRGGTAYQASSIILNFFEVYK